MSVRIGGMTFELVSRGVGAPPEVERVQVVQGRRVRWLDGEPYVQVVARHEVRVGAQAIVRAWGGRWYLAQVQQLNRTRVVVRVQTRHGAKQRAVSLRDLWVLSVAPPTDEDGGSR